MRKELDIFSAWVIIAGICLVLAYGWPVLLGVLLLAAGWHRLMRK